MKHSLLLPFRRTKSNADYDATRPLQPQLDDTVSIASSVLPLEPSPPAVSSKAGFFKTIQSKISRPGLRNRDDTDHGFLLPGPHRATLQQPAAQRDISVEIAATIPDKQSIPTLRYF